jgi:hypothetical protein
MFQLVEVGSPPSMGCMVPQLYAAVGNRSYPGVLGHNRRPMVPRVIYPDRTQAGWCSLPLLIFFISYFLD